MNSLPLPDVAITMRQPWGWATSAGLKLLEIRTRPPPKKYIGARIALHVAHAKPKRKDMVRCGLIIHHERPVIHMSDVDNQRGCIIATFTLDGFVNAQGAKTLPRDLYRWWNPGFGDFGWVLRDVVRFGSSITCSGQLGFWPLISARLGGHLRSAVIAEQVLATPIRSLTTMRDAARAAGLVP